jgi:hypothetical protein
MMGGIRSLPLGRELLFSIINVSYVIKSVQLGEKSHLKLHRHEFTRRVRDVRCFEPSTKHCFCLRGAFSMSEKAKGTPCDGWWQQAGYGQQPMRDLYLEFSAGQINGSGVDTVGQFTFRGTIDAAGRIEMQKQYIGLWTVDYTGAYDGEGLLYGHWRIGGLTDRWLIRLKLGRVAEIHELEATA